ncbi:cell division protein FtsQ [Candidatus Desulfofervidus auxilii]|uniref:Cell division protein FtsQ n=2 Tax=Desulfofervidus auxilii TaxID=1621989 RepID=A0A7U4QMC4_DESA2|nr:FtsQ-type POTRA domain-containing protein [Candidatus Desulfofervidus auxilii]AMM41977.1 cell division protein FtsQ [Candidatus Desulfofervidus auxilii]
MRKNRYKREKTGYKAYSIILGIMGILCLLSIIFTMGYIYLCHLPFFKIKTVQVIGNKLIPTEKILSLANCQGKSLLSIHTAKITHHLLQLPLVKTASVKRRWKDTVKIIITERQPIAWAYIREHWWIVEKNGECTPSLIFESLDLPIITGLSSPNDVAVKTAISLLNLWKQKNLSGQKLSEIHVDENLGLSIFTLEGHQFLLGNTNFAEKLRNLQKVLAYFQRTKNRIKLIDLTNIHRIYAKTE